MPGQIPLIGERFPEIDVVTTKGKLKLPDYFKGKWFILFSHPGDFTPVCTTEFYSFSKRIDEFRKLGVELIGLSVDSNVSHIEWVRWVSYPALKGGASCFTAPPCPWPRAAGRGRSSTGATGGSHPALLSMLRDAL